MALFLILPTRGEGANRYRGKRPTFPRSISAGATGLHVELNNGIRLWAAPGFGPAELPKLDSDFAEYAAAAPAMTAEQYAALIEAAELVRARPGQTRLADRQREREGNAARIRELLAKAAGQAAPADAERETIRANRRAQAEGMAAIARAEQRAAIAETVKTIDMTPTWAGILPALRALIENSNSEGRATAWAELERMAALADERNRLAGRIEAAAELARGTRGGFDPTGNGPAAMDAILSALAGAESIETESYVVSGRSIDGTEYLTPIGWGGDYRAALVMSPADAREIAEREEKKAAATRSPDSGVYQIRAHSWSGPRFYSLAEYEKDQEEERRFDEYMRANP